MTEALVIANKTIQMNISPAVIHSLSGASQACPHFNHLFVDFFELKQHRKIIYRHKLLVKKKTKLGKLGINKESDPVLESSHVLCERRAAQLKLF